MAGELQHDAILAGNDNPPSHPTGGSLAVAIERVNDTVFNISAVPLAVASAVLTFRGVAGHVTGRALKWQDEVTIFLVVGAVLLSAGAVQARRGHIGIELLAAVLPSRLNAARSLFIDTVSLVFCVIFAWKSGGLLLEAI